MKVSIVMPIYNVEKYVSQSIESILNQEHKSFELIVINDGSTDETENIVKTYLSDDRIKYYNIGRLGKIKAFNLGYKYVTSDYICFFHGDDIMNSDFISSRLGHLISSTKTLVACCGKLETISDDDKYNSIIIPKGEKGSLSGQAVMYKKQLTDIIFPIPEMLPNEDYWMRLNIEHFSDELIHVENIIAKYRIHEDNSFLSIGAMKDFKEKSEKIHLRRTVVLNKFIDLYGHKLKIQDNKRINDYLKAEDFRYSGDWLKIIFSNIRFVDKLRFIFESNSTLYYIKNNFSWIFLGIG